MQPNRYALPEIAGVSPDSRGNCIINLAPSGAEEFSPGRKPWVGIAPPEGAPEGAKEASAVQTLTPLPGLWVYCGGPGPQGLRPGLNSYGPPGLNILGVCYSDLAHPVAGAFCT